MDMFCIKFSL